MPIKTIDELRALPESGGHDSGIYFLWRGDELQYIGKSRQVCNRIVQHDQAARFGYGKQIHFDRHTCLSVFSDLVINDVPALNKALTGLERAYVTHYKPIMNVLYRCAP